MSAAWQWLEKGRAFKLLALLAGVSLAGCQYAGLADGLPEGVDCSFCHGNKDNAAPPFGLYGEESESDVVVGAHQAHLKDGALSAAIACEECHVVPDALESPGHVDALPAEVSWGRLAGTQGLEPDWDRNTATCTDTWCHGSLLTGGKVTSPQWTLVDGSQVACDSCHGNPPPLPHPGRMDCITCHPETVDAAGKIRVETGAHINGVVEAPPQDGCYGCHGSEQNAAPPAALDGSTDSRAISVGAHQAHLQDGAVRLAVGCEECHLVPETLEAVGHVDPAPADLVWGPVASAGGAAPVWERSTASCQNVWCHGSGLTGGSVQAPVWTQVDGTQAACGTCHGKPPPPPHPVVTDCSLCHATTVDASGQIKRAEGYHINGVIDVSDMACNACHGSAESDAPPMDTLGNTATTAPGVGAHQAHLQVSSWHGPLACAECHLVPEHLDSPGHVDGALPAELVWGGLATAEGAVPSYDASSRTCSDAYCHTGTLTGGYNPQPLWTKVGGGEVGCGSCHGLPPDAPHPARSDCVTCHACVVDETYRIREENAVYHINGEVNLGACPTP